MKELNKEDIVDIFKEEAKKKKKKEKKKKEKKEKALEKKENVEFEKLAQKANVLPKKEESVFSFLYDSCFGFFLILLVLTTGGFIYLTLDKGIEKNILIQMILLGCGTLFYVLSLTIQKVWFKKLCAILTSAIFCILMIFTLYYV